MITSNVITRVFHLKYGIGTGTCFAIDYDDRQYLVTAKHVIANLKDDETVEIYNNQNWNKVNVKIVGHHPTADVSVFTIDTILSKLKLEPTSNGIFYGQDTYFLGFPYDLQDIDGGRFNRNFPMPLVKKATLSCFMIDETGEYMLLDGINNPGFSGGPVVFTMKNSQDFRVAGIISGFRFENEPTFHQNRQTPITVRANTGIIFAYDIKNAISLIVENPIGKEINK